MNASISRPWSLGSERQLLFRAESINLFNTPQFAEPGRDLVNPNFGQITNTLNDGRDATVHAAVQFLSDSPLAKGNRSAEPAGVVGDLQQFDESASDNPAKCLRPFRLFVKGNCRPLFLDCRLDGL